MTRSFVVVGRYRLMWLMLRRWYEHARMTWDFWEFMSRWLRTVVAAVTVSSPMRMTLTSSFHLRFGHRLLLFPGMSQDSGLQDCYSYHPLVRLGDMGRLQSLSVVGPPWRQRRKNREQYVCAMCDHICRSATGLYSHQCTHRTFPSLSFWVIPIIILVRERLPKRKRE